MMNFNFHRMSLAELKRAQKKLRAMKKPRAPIKHRMLLRAVAAWIKRHAHS